MATGNESAAVAVATLTNINANTALAKAKECCVNAQGVCTRKNRSWEMLAASSGWRPVLITPATLHSTIRHVQNIVSIVDLVGYQIRRLISVRVGQSANANIPQ